MPGDKEMNVEFARSFLGWCTIINYTILIVWFIAFMAARDSLHRLHQRWFRLSNEQLDAVHYGGMAIYKLGIMLFNLVPYIALRIVG
jgi:hypothetical protein